MKKTILSIILVLLLIPECLFGQKENNEIKFKFSGFIRNDAIYNTRQIFSAREEQIFLLAPKPVWLDANGKDINDASNYNIVGINTRLRTNITLPDVFGAKSSGLIEVDFYGVDSATKWHLRMRHAFVKLNWEKSELLIGQYWHGNFIPDCFPGNVAFGSATPINPISRNPQFKFTYKLSENLSAFAVAMGQGHFKGKSPKLSDFNSELPEFHTQLRYENFNKANNAGFLMGAGIGFKSLKPTLYNEVGDMKYVAKERVNSMSIVAYSKITIPVLTIKMHSLYGQNGDNAVQQGGYGIVDKEYTVAQKKEGYVEYSPYNVLSGWIDVHTNGNTWQFGLFGGFSKNMGSKDNIIEGTGVGRWLDVNSMLRIAPRLTYTVRKTKLAFEVEYSSADYASENGTDSKGRITDYNKADNYRFIFAFTQSF